MTEHSERPDEDSRPPYYVQSVERTLAVLSAFSDVHPSRTSAEIAAATGLDRATTRRFLLTLIDLGYVSREGREYTLRPRVLELGFAFLSSLRLPDLAQPHLERLASDLRETCSLGVLDAPDVVFVARVATQKLRSIPTMVGSRFPAHASSIGQVLLAFSRPAELNEYLAHAPLTTQAARTITDPDELRARLAEVRKRGWVVCDRESDDLTASIAVPIHDRSGDVVAALNVSTLAGDDTETRLASSLERIEQAATDIESDLAAIAGPIRRRVGRGGPDVG